MLSGLINSDSRTALLFFQGMTFGTTISTVYSISPSGSQITALIETYILRAKAHNQKSTTVYNPRFTALASFCSISDSGPYAHSKILGLIPISQLQVIFLIQSNLVFSISTLSCRKEETEARLSRCQRIASSLR